MNSTSIKFKITNEIWTGNEKGKNSKYIRETGIIGSLRWWYESIIRGLGGSACAITSIDSNCGERCNEKKRCAVCELFGCTGWARKFRLEIEGKNKPRKEIILHFYELRKISRIEWDLIHLTFEVISKYGSLGGKMVDPKYGLVEIIHTSDKQAKKKIIKQNLEEYFKNSQIKGADYPNFSHFIFLEKPDVKTLNDLKGKFEFIKGQPGQNGYAKKYILKKKNTSPERIFFILDEKNSQSIQNYLEENNIYFKSGEQILAELTE